METLKTLLNLPSTASDADISLAVIDLVNENEQVTASRSELEQVLKWLRAQTAELFAERLRAEGADDEAVSAAKAMWAENPSLAAQAALGADIIEAANPYGCNQYGEGWKQPHNGKQSWRPGNKANKKGDEKKKDEPEQEKKKEPDEKHPHLSRAEDTRPWKGSPDYYPPAPKNKKEADVRLQETKKKFETAQKNMKQVRADLKKIKAKKEEIELEYQRNFERIKNDENAFVNQDSKYYHKAYEDYVNKVQPVIKEMELYEQELVIVTNELEYARSQYEKAKEEAENVSASRTLSEMLDEADAIEAANPYGCNQYGHKSGCPEGGTNDKKDASPAKKTEEDAQKKADELYKLMDEVKKYRNFANKRIIDSSIAEWTKALSKGKTDLQQAETAEEKEEAMKQHLRTIKYGKMLFEDYLKEYSSH